MPFRNHDAIYHIFEILICCFVFAAIFSACGSPMSIASENKEVTMMTSLNTDFMLKIGKEAAIQEEDLLIRFVSVNKDSRCPKGVKCIWEGDAEVLLEVRKGREEIKTFTLHTSQRFNQAELFGSFRIKLISLIPYPEKNMEIKPESYVSTLFVAKE